MFSFKEHSTNICVLVQVFMLMVFCWVLYILSNTNDFLKLVEFKNGSWLKNDIVKNQTEIPGTEKISWKQLW